MSRKRLRMLPSWVYAVKAAYTRGRSLTWLATTRRRTPRRGVRMLFYHRVTPDRDPLGVTPERFRQQMQYLADGGWRVVDVAEAGELLRRGDPMDRVVSLSFDDGYLDVVKNALPILAELGFKATVFVVTGALDGDVSFEWYAQMPPLISWQQVVQLDRDSPLRFEAHTITHPNLLTLDDEQARKEIVGCKAALEERLGRPVEAFNYPAGLFGPRERRMVEEAGYRVAVSSDPGLNSASSDLLALRRTQIEHYDGLLDFRSKVGSGHDGIPPFRGLYRRLRYGATAMTQ
ncbi:MAG TPA: polysaccharide deacetylase family protein [Solirubrobacterales bacterium]|nr:polysaccharide deacetylase family protein [Solirubrobacterales bacterium]